jgi:hypothetical protein
MKLSHKVSLVVSTASLLFGLALPLTALAATATAPGLGTASTYAIFGAAGVTNILINDATHIWGECGC